MNHRKRILASAKILSLVTLMGCNDLRDPPTGQGLHDLLEKA
tara:strand:+ start:451 stop:576 length:126 start_codon:yes stop_codon:yes gene_type:complete